MDHQAKVTTVPPGGSLQTPPRPPTVAPVAAQPAPPPAGPNIGVMIRRALTHWPITLILLVVGIGITFQVVRKRKLTYRSETVIFYSEGIQRGLLGESGDPLKQLGSKLKEMLLSQKTLKVVIDECHIQTDQVRDKGYTEVVDGLRKKIDFKARTSDTFAITFDGSSRDEAQEVTAKLAEMLIEETTRRRENQAKSATEFLDAEKKRLDDELAESDRAVAKFVGEHPEYALEASTRAGTQVRAESKKLDAAGKLDASSDKARIKQQKLDNAGGPTGSPGPGPKKSPGAAPPPEAPPELVAQKKAAQAELAKAQKEFDDLSQKYTPEYPDVQAAGRRRDQAQAAVAAADAAIAAATPKPEAPPQRSDADDPYSEHAPPRVAVQAPVQSEVAKEKEKSKTAQQMAEIDVEWQRLSRANEAARQRVADLDQKRFRAEMQASATMSGDVGQIAVLDPAFKPNSPVGMPNSLAAMVGLVVSILAGVAGAAARGIVLDDRIYDASEIEGLEIGPVLAVLPRAKKERGRLGRG